MSEQQNVDRVVAMYEAFSRGDVGFIVDQLADDVRWVSRLDPIVPWSGPFAGKADVPRFFAAIMQATEVDSFSFGEFIAQGETVVSLGEFVARVKATGKPLTTRWVFVWKFSDGLVASYEQFHDTALADAFR